MVGSLHVLWVSHFRASSCTFSPPTRLTRPHAPAKLQNQIIMALVKATHCTFLGAPSGQSGSSRPQSRPRRKPWQRACLLENEWKETRNCVPLKGDSSKLACLFSFSEPQCKLNRKPRLKETRTQKRILTPSMLPLQMIATLKKHSKNMDGLAGFQVNLEGMT